MTAGMVGVVIGGECGGKGGDHPLIRVWNGGKSVSTGVEIYGPIPPRVRGIKPLTRYDTEVVSVLVEYGEDPTRLPLPRVGMCGGQSKWPQEWWV